MVIKNMKWCIFVGIWLIPQISASVNKCLENDLYEHPTDCDKFYSCAPFGPVLMYCPAGLHFNPQYLICDWPQEAKCMRKQTADLGSTMQPCPIFPHPQDCTKFYLCSTSGLALKRCPEGLYFNPHLLVCDWPHNVKCTEPKTSTTRYPLSTTGKTSTKPTVATSENIEIFSDGVSSLGITENVGSSTPSTTALKPSTSINTVPQNNNTSSILNTSSDLIASKLNSTLLCESPIWPHHNNCTKFFMCGSTGAEEKLCPKNLLFNPALLVCDWPYNVKCSITLNMTNEMTTVEGTQNVSTTTLTTTGFHESFTKEYIYESTFTYNHFKTTTIENLNETTTENIVSTNEPVETTTVLEEIPMFEKEHTNVISFETTLFDSTTETITISQSTESNPVCLDSIWPHSDCTKFYICGSTGAEEVACPKEMHFNPLLLICDSPRNAGCLEFVNVTTDISTREPKENASTITPTSFPETISTENSFDSTYATENLPEAVSGEKITSENILFTNSETTMQNEEITTKYPNNIDTQSSGIAYESTTSKFTTTYQSIDSIGECEGSIWPHPTDCTKYFICGASGAVEMICSEELKFHPLLLVCDWPHNVKCIDHAQMTTTEVLPDISTLNNSEIETTDDNISTASNLYLETSTIENLDTVTTENTSSDEYVATTLTADENATREVTSITTQPSETTFVSTITESPNILQSTNSTKLCESSVWPHPSDCTKYFMCGAIGAVEITCPKQLFFNPSLLICDWPLNVQCNNHSEKTTTELLADPPATTLTTTGYSETVAINYISTTSSGIVDVETSTTEDLEDTTNENIKTTTISEESAMKEFTTQNPETMLDSTTIKSTTTIQSTDNTNICKESIWPHQHDCTKYFTCGANGAVEISCPEQLHFNPLLLICDLPHNVQCNKYVSTSTESFPTGLSSDASTTLIDTTSFSEDVTTEQPLTSTNVTEHLETTIIDELDKITLENIFPSHEHTESTKTTQENTPKEFTSPITESFTTTFVSSTEYIPTSQGTDSTALCKSTIWPHPNDCTKFFVCSSTGIIEMVCSGQMHFNPGLLVCDSTYNSKCKDSLNMISEITTPNALTEYETTVTSITSTKFPLDLETGVVTNIAENFLETVTTDQSSPSNYFIEYVETTTEDNFTADDILMSTSYGQTETNGNTRNPLTSTTPIPQTISTSTIEPKPAFLSTEQCQGSIWPHPEDCQKFFICGSDKAVEMFCPKQLHFNPELLTCDWPEHAGCTAEHIAIRSSVI